MNQTCANCGYEADDLDAEMSFCQTCYRSWEIGESAGEEKLKKKILRDLELSFALYIGFYPAIGEELLNQIRRIDPARAEEIDEILAEKRAKK